MPHTHVRGVKQLGLSSVGTQIAGCLSNLPISCRKRQILLIFMCVAYEIVILCGPLLSTKPTSLYSAHAHTMHACGFLFKAQTLILHRKKEGALGQQDPNKRLKGRERIRYLG